MNAMLIIEWSDLYPQFIWDFAIFSTKPKEIKKKSSLQNKFEGLFLCQV